MISINYSIQLEEKKAYFAVVVVMEDGFKSATNSVNDLNASLDRIPRGSRI